MPILVTVSLLVDHQSIPIHITFCLVVLRLTLYASYSLLWYSHTYHSLPGGSDNPYTHHSLPRGTQTIPLLNIVCLVVLRLSIYSSQSHWWYSDYPYTHHSLPGDTQTILVFITAGLVVLGLSLYSSQSLWWSSVYP